MEAVKTAVNGAADKVAASTIGNAKQRQLNAYTVDAGPSDPLTTYWGTKVDKTDVSIKAGSRGPAIVNDFHAREKIQHFDHSRIPERAVHARGAGAHGVFRLKKSLSDVTMAKVLSDVGKETPVFVRFSTVSGSRGSADTVRDVRGFAIKFYTEEGIWDLVGNNIPIFFIQDSIQFPDLVHAVKPNPQTEIPQAQTAHDNAWDFMSLNEASVSMMMWVMSGRTIPRNFSTMPGFGVHTFAFVNEEGKRTFVKFSLKPRAGTHSNVWSESLSLAGNDPDFHRRTLYTQIDNGAYPTWDFCVQLLDEEREHEFDFDILDSTKFWPEELVPSTIVGELELNRNVDNYFAETEQVAFCTQHVVPGIQFTDDPLLAWRNFSYQDTQISRLGSMNFAEIPINSPIGRCPVMNNLRDGQHRMTIAKNNQPYFPNRFSNNHPAGPGKGVFTHYPAPVEGLQERLHSDKFRNNHYSQATLFYNSLHPIEKEHLISAVQFELGKCDEQVVQQNSINRLNKVDHDMAVQIASAFDNITVPDEEIPNHGKRSDYLSLIDGKDQVFTAKGRQVGIFVLPGFSGPAVSELKAAFLAAGVVPMIVGPSKGTFEGYDTQFTFETCRSGLFDGLIFIGDNDDSEEYVNKLRKLGKVRFALIEGYAHKKPIMLHGNTIKWGTDIALPGEFTPSAKEGSGLKVEKGVIFTPSAGTGVQMASTFLDLLAKHRVWDRETDHLAA